MRLTQATRQFLTFALALALVAPVAEAKKDKAARPKRDKLEAGVDVTLSSSTADKVKFIYRDYYGFSGDEVEAAMRAYPEEAAALLRIAQSAVVPPADVIAARRGGKSLFELTDQFELNPAIFFVGIKSSKADKLGPPFGRAWGWYSRYKHEWPRSAYMADDEIVAVNHIRLQSQYLDESPLRVIRLLEKMRDPNGILVSSFDSLVLEPAVARAEAKKLQDEEKQRRRDEKAARREQRREERLSGRK